MFQRVFVIKVCVCVCMCVCMLFVCLICMYACKFILHIHTNTRTHQHQATTATCPSQAPSASNAQQTHSTQKLVKPRAQVALQDQLLSLEPRTCLAASVSRTFMETQGPLRVFPARLSLAALPVRIVTCVSVCVCICIFRCVRGLHRLRIYVYYTCACTCASHVVQMHVYKMYIHI